MGGASTPRHLSYKRGEAHGPTKPAMAERLGQRKSPGLFIQGLSRGWGWGVSVTLGAQPQTGKGGVPWHHVTLSGAWA